MAKIRFTKEANEKLYQTHPHAREIIEREGTVDSDGATWLHESTVRKINPNHKILAHLDSVRSGKQTAPKPQAPKEGPGTELKKMLAKIGITTTKGCSCNARAAEMNRQGVAWCEKNIETIVGWLRDEAAKRKLAVPMFDLVARRLVKIAIKRAKPELTQKPS